MKYIIPICALLFLSACKPGDTKLDKPRCANPSTFQMDLYEVLQEDDDIFQQLLKAIPKIEGFMPNNVPGQSLSYVFGMTLSRKFQDKIVAEIEKVLDPNLNIKPIWSKYGNRTSYGSHYFLYLTKDNEHQMNISCSEITGSKVTKDKFTGSPVVAMSFDAGTTKEWFTMTSKAFNEGKNPIAIVVGNVVYNCPIVSGVISTGKMSLSFNYVESANAFAELIAQ